MKKRAGQQGRKIDHSAKPEAQSPPLRSRELHKANKRQRIKTAARTLFASHGYDRASLREIAQVAGVALGTLSLYANDKRDLVLLMFNDEMAELIARAAKRLDPASPFLENAMQFFGVFYEDFGANVQLARTFLQQNFFFDGKNTAALAANEARIIEHLRGAIGFARTNGEVREDEPAEVLAQSVYLTYVAAVRWWIADERPLPPAGIAHLRKLLTIQFRGLVAARNVSAGADNATETPRKAAAKR